LNLEKTTFLNDHFYEIAVYDISIQRYKQKYAKKARKIEALRDKSPQMKFEPCEHGDIYSLMKNFF